MQLSAIFGFSPGGPCSSVFWLADAIGDYGNVCKPAGSSATREYDQQHPRRWEGQLRGWEGLLRLQRIRTPVLAAVVSRAGERGDSQGS